MARGKACKTKVAGHKKVERWGKEAPWWDMARGLSGDAEWWAGAARCVRSQRRGNAVR